MGLSDFSVNNKGHLHTCKYCISASHRLEPHTALKIQTNYLSDTAKTLMKNICYNLNCYHRLHHALWNQLLAILENYQCQQEKCMENIGKIRND